MNAHPASWTATPKWFSAWLRPVVVCAILVPGIPALVTLAPIPYHVSVAFTLGGVAANSSVYSAPGPGTLRFSWSANTSDLATVAIFEWPADASNQSQAVLTAREVYAESGFGGTGAVPLKAGYDYEIMYGGASNQAVRITGSIWGSESILRILQG